MINECDDHIESMQLDQLISEYLQGNPVPRRRIAGPGLLDHDRGPRNYSTKSRLGDSDETPRSGRGSRTKPFLTH